MVEAYATSRGLYDYIAVGPTQSLMPAGSDGGSTATVHVRRGHYHHYWVGKGRTTYIVKFLDPIIVNKHLLDEDEAPPAPRDYVLH